MDVDHTLRAPFSGTFLQRKDVVNQCLEFVSNIDTMPLWVAKYFVHEEPETSSEQGRSWNENQACIAELHRVNKARTRIA